MDVSWSDVGQLFGWAILAALVAGAVCPLVGCFLYVRRTSFYGITLPQFAAAGVAFGFAVMPWWIEHVGLGDLDVARAMGDSHAAQNYHLAWAAVFTFGGLAALVALGRRGGSEAGRVAASFALATAATVLFAHLSAFGDVYVGDLLRGEILAVDVHQFETIAAILGLVLLALVVFHRDLVLVAFDRETAVVLGKRVLAFEVLSIALTGLTVSVGTMTVGPMVLFGLLVLPPIAARPWARSMQAYLALSAALGVAAVAGGVLLSFRLDVPLGPAVVAAAAVELLPIPLARRLA